MRKEKKVKTTASLPTLLPLKKLWVATDAERVFIMTKREFLTQVIEGTVSEETIEFAKAEIVKLDAELAKAAEKRAAKKAENAPLMEALQAILTDEPMTASQIAENVEGINNASKATVIAKALVEAGIATVTEVKVKGRAVKGYSKA